MTTLLQKLVIALSAILVLFHAHPHFGGAVPSLTTIECHLAFQGQLFDTPSGHMQEGYYDATKETPAIDSTTSLMSSLLPAHELGTAAWKECVDLNGYVHEVQISNAEYASYGVKNATIPAQDVLATTTSPVN